MRKANEDLLKEIERQVEMGVDCVADKDKWMLEVDLVQLKKISLKEKQYWLYEVEAARQAGTRAMEMTEGATNNWADVMNNDALSQKLPKTTPVPNEEDKVPVSVHSPLPEDKSEGARQERTLEEQHAPSPLPEDGSEEE